MCCTVPTRPLPTPPPPLPPAAHTEIAPNLKPSPGRGQGAATPRWIPTCLASPRRTHGAQGAARSARAAASTPQRVEGLLGAQPLLVQDGGRKSTVLA